MEVEKGIYRHAKGGTYTVLGVGYHSESLEKLVVYQSLNNHGDFPKGTLWVRPLALFLGKNAHGQPRFTKI
tara:strand:+ start:23210 stop:23422 length:213 start_codon:yes stop_codon:yes gene_type:complete